MAKDVVGSGTYRFGAYELDSARRVLLRNGERVSLTPKALDVLLVLLDRPGETIAKDELLRAVWPDTAVEEISLTRNVSVLRKVFGEKPNEHNYIVTVPGTGYRFVAEVEPGPKPASPATVPPWRKKAWLMASIAVAATGSIWFFWPAATPLSFRPVPLTSNQGLERNPTISPDGKRVAFSWDGEKPNRFDIYVKTLNADSVYRLTADPADELSPAWSPDGRSIAFVRQTDPRHGEIIRISLSGGPERKLADIRGEFRSELPSLSWSPDGKWLAASHREDTDSANGIFLISTATGAKRRVTVAPRGQIGDYMPSFSPDARYLAFVRLSGWVAGAIYIQSLTSLELSTFAEPIRLTQEPGLTTSPAWTIDGRHLIYVFGRANSGASHRELRISSISPGQSQRQISMPDENISEMSFRQPLLVYTHHAYDSDIWRVGISAHGLATSTPERLIASTRHDGSAQYSPDGKRIAFGSTRSGSREIWVANSDGSDPKRITSLRGPEIGVISWSPDGGTIVFHARGAGQGDLFSISPRGGTPRRLTEHESDDLTPSASHDGRWIYFSSMRSGNWEIWKMPSAGGAATQVTRSDGSYLPIESPDGKELYYCHKIPEKGIWKLQVAGGQPEQVAPAYAPPLCGIRPVQNGLFYTGRRQDQYTIEFLSFSTGQSRVVVTSARPFAPLALSVSPDERWLLYVQANSNSDLMMVDNFAMN